MQFFYHFLHVVWGGIRSLLPKRHAVLQLLGQSDCGPAEENSQQKPVSRSLIPTSPLSREEAARSGGDTFPLYWLSRTLLPSTNVPRQQGVSPPNWSLSLIRLWEGGGISDQCSSAFQTHLQSAWHGTTQRGRIDVFYVTVTLMPASHGGSVLMFLQVEHDPTDRECILQPDQEWDGAAGRNSSGSIL